MIVSYCDILVWILFKGYLEGLRHMRISKSSVPDALQEYQMYVKLYKIFGLE